MVNKRSSASWHGLKGLEPGVLHDKIQAALSVINFKQLEKIALATRLQRDKTIDPGTTCTIDPSIFTHGYNNLIFELEFSDCVYWVARIPHSVDSSEIYENGVNIRSEIETMRTIKEQTTIPIPEVYAYDISPSNEIGSPFLLMESLPGGVLEGPIAWHVPLEHLPKVAKQLAEVMFQLQGLKFNRLGRLWRSDDGEGSLEILPVGSGESTPGTSLEWFYKQRQEANTQALRSHAGDPEWLTACWVLKTALLHIVVESQLHGPFPLCHLDLHHGNLLFDDDYNLTGVIDWSQAQTVPLERLAVCPEFVTFPAGSEEDNQKILDLRELVREYLQHLEKLGQDIGNTSRTLLSQLVGSKRAEITHRCTYSFPHRALWDGRLVAGLIYGDRISWEQLVSVYKGLELC